ncbi:MAG: hypothetical protein MSS69_11145 [Spirochaetales bacterium]|nr:hypothetical protein [Spirochaetales bacterium]
MKRVFVLVIFILFMFPLFSSEVDARFIETDSPIYAEMDALYALSTLASPNTNRPWTESQARLYLSKIDPNSLNEEGKRLYESVEEEINKGLRWEYEDGFSLSGGITFSNEFYAHTNSDFDTEEEWVRSWTDRKPLIRLWGEVSTGEMFYTSADILYRYGRAAMDDHYGLLKDIMTSDGYIASYVITDPENTPYVVSSKYFSDKLSSNFFTNTQNFSFIWPRRAIFSVGGDRWNVSFSRDRMKLGKSHIGSLLVDDHSDYTDSFRATFFNKYFTYDWVLMPLNTLTSDSEDPTTEARLYMIHTLDFRIFDRVSLKVSENVMWKYNVFDIGYLNPSFFFHNLNNRSMFNALAYIEVNAAVTKGLSIYAQYAMDQARAPHEGDGQSDAWGFSLGGEYTFTATKGIFTLYSEYLLTSPLLYRRDEMDFIKVSRYYHQGSDNDTYGHIPFFEYIGYRYGGDTNTVKTGVTYTLPSWGNAEFYVQLMEHGAMSIYSSHNKYGKNEDEANIKESTPTGDNVLRAVTVSLKGDFDISNILSWPGISLYGEADWIGTASFNKENKTYSDYKTDFQLSLGVSVAI